MSFGTSALLEDGETTKRDPADSEMNDLLVIKVGSWVDVWL
jgi:hypothetical protein